jgi:hypothetical protein
VRLPVTLVPKASPRLAGALVAAHALAAFALVPTGLPLAAKLALALAVCVSLIATLIRHALRPSLAALTLRGDGRLDLERRDGTHAEATVDRCTTVFSWLVVLLLRTEGGKIALTLPSDALGPDQHRRLRLWLRWQAAVD